MKSYREPDTLPDDGTGLVYDYDRKPPSSPLSCLWFGIALGVWVWCYIAPIAPLWLQCVPLALGLVGGVALTVWSIREDRRLERLGITAIDEIVANFDKKK